MIAQSEPTADNHVVLYRIGDFWTAWGNHAVVLSKALGVALHKRRVRRGMEPEHCAEFPVAHEEHYFAQLRATGWIPVLYGEAPVEPTGRIVLADLPRVKHKCDDRTYVEC